MASSNTNLQTVQVIYCTFLLLFWVIVCPIAFYYCYEIWQLRHETFWKKRYPKLTIAVVLSVAYWAGIGRPIGDLSDIFPSIHKKIPIPISNSPLSQLCLVLMYIRVWFLYYDYNHGLQLISKQWETALLSPTDSTVTLKNTVTTPTKSYWTLSKKWEYLSAKYNVIYYVAISYVMITDIILIIASLQSTYLEYLFYTGFVGMSLFPILFVAIKVRKCRDELFLHSELKLLAYLGVVVLLSYLLCKYVVSEVSVQKLLRHIMINIEGTVAVFIITKYVINKYKQRRDGSAVHAHVRSTTPLSLGEILQNVDAFELFAVHLVKEFSIENLLFLYEAMKFKEQCVQKELIKIDEVGVVLQFPKRINNIQPMDISYKYIIDRYIHNAAAYPINVSYTTRVKMIQVMEKCEADKQTIINYVQCIDEAINEIMHLLSSDSLVRFGNTNAFKKLYS